MDTKFLPLSMHPADYERLCQAADIMGYSVADFARLGLHNASEAALNGAAVLGAAAAPLPRMSAWRRRGGSASAISSSAPTSKGLPWCAATEAADRLTKI